MEILISDKDKEQIEQFKKDPSKFEDVKTIIGSSEEISIVFSIKDIEKAANFILYFFNHKNRDKLIEDCGVEFEALGYYGSLDKIKTELKNDLLNIIDKHL